MEAGGGSDAPAEGCSRSDTGSRNTNPPPSERERTLREKNLKSFCDALWVIQAAGCFKRRRKCGIKKVISGLESNSVLGLFLTGDVVLVSAVGEKRLQLAETLPGFRSAVEASQVVQVRSWTDDKQTNISFMFLS